jgi:hypothetical protein
VNRLEDLLPGLRGTEHRITSPPTIVYNCIAWAAGDDTNWWWPGRPDKTFWPTNLPRAETLEAFEALFAHLGFSPSQDESFETGIEKVALFARPDGRPTHAARQIPSGRWTSKLGRMEDIEHDLRAIEGEVYGTVVRILRRPVGL